MELVFPLGVMVAILGGGALALGLVSAWWSSTGRTVSSFAVASWQWCLAFVTAVAALMLAHVTGFGLTVPGVTRVIGDLGVVWGSERWSDALAFALDPVAASILAGPMLLAALTAFVDTARPSPTATTRRRSVAMALALAGLACLAMARSHGGAWAGWVTVAAASLFGAWPECARRPDAARDEAATDERHRRDVHGWAALARREVASIVLVAVAGVCIAWVMPSWAFDPVALAVVPGDDSLLRQAGPLGAPVAETITVVLLVAAILRLDVWPTSRRSASAAPDLARDTLAVVRDVSAIALLVRYDVVAALAPVPLAGLGVLAAIGAVISAARLAASQRCAASRGDDAVDPRPAAASLALLAIASFLPELAVAVSAVAGATWWALRRVPSEGARLDGALRLLLAPIPVGLGLAVTATAVGTWTHVSALSPILNVVASAACIAVGVALAVAATVDRDGLRGGATQAANGVLPHDADVVVDGDTSVEARRAAQVLLAGALLLASALLVPMPDGSPLSRAFAAHVAIPRGLTGVYAVGAAEGWGDRSVATSSTFALVVVVFLAATVWAWRRHPTATGQASESDRARAFVAWFDASALRARDGAAATLRGLGRAFEFGVSRVAMRDFVALASDELDRAAIASPARRRGRAAIGLAVVAALVLGAIFANRDAATLTPTSLHGFPGLRARLGAADEATPAPNPTLRADESGRGARGGS